MAPTPLETVMLSEVKKYVGLFLLGIRKERLSELLFKVIAEMEIYGVWNSNVS